jgi:hypothetical protein
MGIEGIEIDVTNDEQHVAADRRDGEEARPGRLALAQIANT